MSAERSERHNVAVLLREAATRRSGEPAVIAADGHVIWSFERLAETAARVAGGLAEAGVEVGDRVLVLVPDVARRYAVVAGILWAGGAVVVPAGSVSPLAALAAAASLDPRAVVFGPLIGPAIIGHGALRRIPVRVVTGGPWQPGSISLRTLEHSWPIEPRLVPGDSPALVSFTTGSTGAPRPVVRSHDVLLAQHDALRDLRMLSDCDRDLAGLPLLVLHNLAAGVTSILPPPDHGTSQFGSKVLGALVASRATSAAGFPHLFDAAVRSGTPCLLRDVRAIHVGGDRVAPELLRALRRLAPAAGVTVVYGSTEVEPIAAIGASDYLDALAASDPVAGICAGRVVAGIALRVAPNDRLTRAGSAGARPEEVEARDHSVPMTGGPILVCGSRAAGTSGPNGWVATGDTGWVDDEDRLWLLGRTDNTVGKLCQFQVERAAEGLDGVRRAAFVRTQVASRPQALLAVEPYHWASAQGRADLEASVRRLVADRAWRIDEIVLVRRMPTIHGAARKVDGAQLRSRAASARGADATAVRHAGSIAGARVTDRP